MAKKPYISPKQNAEDMKTARRVVAQGKSKPGISDTHTEMFGLLKTESQRNVNIHNQVKHLLKGKNG